jgi:hypothetical protein
MKTRERNHFYIFTVELRRVEIENDQKVIYWDEAQIEGCNIHEVAGKLKRPLADIRYKHKDILKGDHMPTIDKTTGELEADFIKKQLIIAQTPPRQTPTTPLRAKRAQNDAPLPLEMVVINAQQGRLF